MSGLHGRMPYTTAFERAMGTGMIIQSATALDDGFRSKLDAFIDGYESVLSRFRADSLVTGLGLRAVRSGRCVLHRDRRGA